MEKVLERVKKEFTSNELIKGNYGIEREVLRTTESGELSFTHHPKIFGDKIKNPYITTDFSESQMEFITPVFKSVKEVYDFSCALYDIAAMEINDEYLWPQSMPCIIPNDKEIPIAKFEDHEHGNDARKYREKLLYKYGGKRQLISGIHYNFSFDEGLLKKIYRNKDLCCMLFGETNQKQVLSSLLNKDITSEISYKEFKNKIYLKTARNYLRYRWLLIYLLGASNMIHDSYIEGSNEFIYNNKDAISFRNSEFGYRNKIDLIPNYNSVKEYVDSINAFIKDELIDSHKELYSPLRLKVKNPYNFMNSLINDGIEYLEFRSVDINPFEKCGISLDDLEFLQVFNLFALFAPESHYDLWQEESLENQNKIATHGHSHIMLLKDGKSVDAKSYGLDILENIKYMCNELNLNKSELIDKMIEKIKDSKLTYSYKIKELCEKEGYINAHLNLASKYKKDSYNNRFKLQGYEDLELSTQILMKESIKRGINTKVIDRSENFIELKRDDKIEYVKQATKTSKDNYVTVLIMENKSVTKTVLREHNINVPEGIEVFSLQEAESYIKDFEMKSIVVKPKSTNFGTGISIFKDGGSYEDIKKALEIAFRYDNTVLIEKFIRGKEYRFLVINDEVVGILHRVPANVKGDGINSIRKLVEIKNTDPLRGYHYVTPLEKIKLDEHAELFLKSQNKDFDYVPDKDEVVYLRENSNISTGGDSIDYTDDISDKFKKIAVECSKAVNAKICGVDMMIEDYSNEDSEYGIIELNFNPAIHIHSYPYSGKERKIAEKILKLLQFI